MRFGVSSKRKKATKCSPGHSPVREVRAKGLLVVSVNMAGSVPDAADLVVTDTVQAGVMTVMAVADTAKFTVGRLTRRVF
jgi:energy-converting hydrogenase B subunit Q